MKQLRFIKRSNFLRRLPQINTGGILYVLLMLTVLYIINFQLNLLTSEILVKEITVNGIDYDAFRDIRITRDNLEQAEHKIRQIIKKNPVLKDVMYIDSMGYITFSMMGNNYNLIDYGLVNEKTFLRGIGKVAMTDSFQELYRYYNAVLTDLKYFPVPRIKNEEADVSFTNSWYVLRKYGGNRRHEGTDVMATNNIRGFFPIVSITDGVVEKLGWLEQGGYRIGIRTEAGGYFYYAHLHSYAPEIKVGDTLIAGQLIGFMGDSGYGSEGTIGQFDVHLHLGIYVPSTIGEMSINPYWILRILDDNRIQYDYN